MNHKKVQSIKQQTKDTVFGYIRRIQTKYEQNKSGDYSQIIPKQKLF